MKKIKQILGVVAVFLLVVGCYSQTLQAKELTNSEMIEDSNMELYGQAKFLDDDSIQLTPLETNSSGCVWYPHSVDTTQDFSITVSYWIGGGRELPYEGADGMILGFTEKKGIGSNGEYQGFVSGEKSYGVELDSYPYNRGDPDGKHIAIIKNNVRNHLKYVLDDRVDDSAWHKLSVSYKAKEKTLTVYLDEKEVLASDGIELSQKCYLGISAATASGCNQHLIKNISIDGKIGQGRKIKYSIKDTYSFVNLTDKIPEKIYTKKFGQLLGRALRTIHDGTAGQCYGMAATVAASAEYNSPAASSYVDESNKKVENLFDVKPDMKSLQSKVTASEYIKCAFLEQIKPGALSQRLFSVNQLNKLYNKVKENVYNDGEPVIIEIQDGGGHALLATGTGEDTEEQTEILVYDCNYPKTMRSLYLLKNEKGKYKGWQYKTPYKEYSGGENYLGGLYDDKYISYNTTTKKVIQSFENYKGGKKEKIDTYALIKPSKTKDDIELLKGYKGSLELEKIGKDESIIPISVVTGNSDDCVGQYYWVNNDKIKFKSNTENSSYVITSENIEVGMAVPKNSEATVDISKKNTPVSLKLSGDRKFEIEYTTTDNKENIILYKIQGIGGEEVSCEKNGSEIDITGVKNIETTISIGDKEISKNNISDLSEGDTYILNVNDNTFRRTEKIENNNVNIKVIANENGIAAARPLWLPALSKEIDIHDINVENIMFAGSIKAVVGMIDNPESQSQYPYYIDFSEFSNLMIVGNQGCGKSTFIQTILYSMAMNYHSDDVNFYILDFSSGLLHNFMKLPHCGNVAQVDEEDSVNRTIRYLISVIEERNQIFKKAGVGGFWEFKKISKEPMPLLLLVIDNYFAFGENYESLEGDITTLLRSGFRCGIQVIVSANRMNDMKFRLRQNITRVVPLQLNERMDYMEALGSYLAGFTATVRGRGLCKEEEILEFQTALVSSEKTEYERIRKVSAEFEAMAKTEKYHARSILVLPENETYGEFLEKMPEEMLEDYIPIGYEQKEIQPYTVSLKESFCYLISGIGRKGVDNLLENTTEYLAATENLPTKKELYLVHLNKNCAIEEERAEAVYKNDEDIFSMLLFLKEEFTKRNKWRKEYLAEGKEERLYSILKKEFAQLFFIIDDFTAFLELVYKSHGTESYFPITELFFKEGKGLGIYFIAGIDTGNSASAVYTQAYKNFTNEKKGIHLGGQLNQQNLFQFQIPITKQLTRLDDNIGCFVEKETPYSVFIPWNQSQ